MNQKGFVNIIAVVVIILLASTIGHFIVNRQILSPFPISLPTPSHTPTQSPQPPTSAPTPSDGTGSAKSSTGTVQPEDPNKAGLSLYPDLPITSLFTESVSVKFVVEHRSALNSKTIKVRGVIVGTLLGEKACPSDRGMCTKPNIFLTDTTDESRNKLYDLRVLVNEEEQEKNYHVGKTIEIQVVVDGNKAAVIARKMY